MRYVWREASRRHARNEEDEGRKGEQPRQLRRAERTAMGEGGREAGVCEEESRAILLVRKEENQRHAGDIAEDRMQVSAHVICPTPKSTWIVGRVFSQPSERTMGSTRRKTALEIASKPVSRTTGTSLPGVGIVASEKAGRLGVLDAQSASRSPTFF
ncbi:hypothetical protein KM043_006572 [Ampulex compressa]|nr:hypothetical protein KM043_006572 [Ampulex compressa]